MKWEKIQMINKKIFTKISCILGKRSNLFLVLIFGLGIFFRLVNIGNFGIGFDQVQILKNANQIINKDISLIGPRTGPANMFTGPLIYYLSVPFVFIFGNFNSVFLVPLFLSLVTGLTLFYLSKKYLGSSASLILTSLWSFSPFIVNLDRVFWNPNLMLLSTILIFLSIIALIRDKQDKFIYFMLFLGSFLSYQAHFSGFLLIALALLSIIYLRKNKKLIIPILFGLFLSIIPTVIFDIRNDFLNLKGLVSLLSDKGQFSLLALINDIYHNIYIVIETLGKIFFFGNSPATIISFGLLISIISLIQIKKEKESEVSFLWLLIIAISFSFYKGVKPEYYFLIAVPPLFHLVLKLLDQLEKKQQIVIFFFFFANSFFVNTNYYKNNSGMTNGNINKIKTYLQNKNVKSIIYDVSYGSEIGIKYMLSDIEYKNNGEIYHISYPNELSFNGIKSVSDLGIWVDLRDNSSNYVSTKRYFIETSANYQLFRDEYPKNTIQYFDSYKVVENNKVLGSLMVALESNDKLDWVQYCLEQKVLKNYDWISLSSSEHTKFSSGHCLKIEVSSNNLINLDKIRLF